MRESCEGGLTAVDGHLEGESGVGERVAGGRVVAGHEGTDGMLAHAARVDVNG